MKGALGAGSQSRVYRILAVTRPVASGAGAGCFVLGFYLAGTEPIRFSFGDVLACSSVLLAFAAFMVFNDIFDVEADMANLNTRRPLVNGTITRRTAWTVFFVCGCTSLLLGGYLGRGAMFWAVLFLLLGLVYTLYVRRVFWLGNIYVAFVASLPIIYGADTSGIYSTAVVFAQVEVFLFMLQFEIIKTMRDIVGDRAAGYRTFGVVCGERATMRIWLIVSGVLVSTTTFAALVLRPGLLFYVIFGFGVFVPLMYVAQNLIADRAWEHCIRVLTYAWLPGFTGLGFLR